MRLTTSAELGCYCSIYISNNRSFFVRLDVFGFAAIPDATCYVFKWFSILFALSLSWTMWILIRIVLVGCQLVSMFNGWDFHLSALCRCTGNFINDFSSICLSPIFLNIQVTCFTKRLWLPTRPLVTYPIHIILCVQLRFLSFSNCSKLN